MRLSRRTKEIFYHMSFENPNLNNESHKAIEDNLRIEQIHKSELVPEIVKRIERAKIEIDDKVNIILTKGGLKPASEILLVIKTWYNKGFTRHMSEKDVQECLSIIRTLGLPYCFGERKIVEVPYSTRDEPDRQRFFQRDQMNILIGRTPRDLEFLERALKSNSDEMLGKAFGYPPTAIEAFIGKRAALNHQSLPPDVQCSDKILFSSPALSQDNWQKEAEPGQLYGEFIRKISPKLYKLYKKMRLKAV